MATVAVAVAVIVAGMRRGPPAVRRLVRVGVGHRIHHPELVPLDVVAGDFPVRDLRTLRRFGVERCMRLRVDPAGSGTVTPGDREAGPSHR